MVSICSPVVRLSAVTAVIVCAALGLLATAAADTPQQTLMGELPHGYKPANCQPHTGTLDPPTALVEVDCGFNHAPGGPKWANFVLFANADDLNADFTHNANFVNIQPNPDGSTGPQTWSRAATPNQPAGSYFFANADDGTQFMEWIDTAKLIEAWGTPSTEGADFQKWMTNG